MGSDPLLLILKMNDKYVANNFIALILILFFVVLFIIRISTKYKYTKLTILLFSFLYHTAASLIFYFLEYNAMNDSTSYYCTAMVYSEGFLKSYGTGFDFVVFILYPLVNYLHLSYFTSFMIFNLLGYIGLIFLYIALGKLIQDDKRAKKYLLLVLFLPGINYWTSTIGKDAVACMALGMLLFTLTNIKKNWLLSIISLILILHVRPYILLIVGFSLMLTILLLAKQIGIFQRIIFSIFLIGLLILGADIFVEKMGFQAMDMDTAQTYLEARQSHWSRGGSTLDISNYNIVLKIFTFLYRPLFFDARNIYMVISSFENLILIFLTMRLFTTSFIRFILKEKDLFTRFNAVYSVASIVLCSMATANLGTAVRTKVMVLMSLLSLIVLYIAKKPELANVRPRLQETQVTGPYKEIHYPLHK